MSLVNRAPLVDNAREETCQKLIIKPLKNLKVTKGCPLMQKLQDAKRSQNVLYGNLYSSKIKKKKNR